MKKAIAVLICVFLSLVCLCPAVAESEQYIKVTSENVEFMRPISKDTLFQLPNNVYLKLIDTEGLYYKVEYCGVTGLVLATDITDTSLYSNLSQYYHSDITVHFTQNAVNSTRNFISYTSSPLSIYPGTSTIETSEPLKLIGKHSDGNNVFLFVEYALSNTEKIYGFVNKDDTDWDETANPILAPIETPTNGEQTGQPNTDTTTPNNAPQTTEPTNNLVRVVLIIGICIPAFLIVYLIFKPIKPTNDVKNPRRRQDDYEDFE